MNVVASLFTMVFLWILFQLAVVFAADYEWKFTKIYTLFSSTSIQSSATGSPAQNSFSVRSKLACLIECSKRSSLSYYFDKTASNCYCTDAIDGTDGIGAVGNGHQIYYGTRLQMVKIFEHESNVKIVVERTGYTDCLSLYHSGLFINAIYTLQLDTGNQYDAVCDMTAGGWTVVQRRLDGSENFVRTWDEYVEGFGDTTGEYWIGLKTLHLFTLENSELYIHLQPHDGQSRYAHYGHFQISDSSDNYRLDISDFSGDVDDGMAWQNGMQFTTIDRDNDQDPNQNCAVVYHNGWWSNACHEANLNGEYDNTAYGMGINWKPTWSYYESLKETIMKIRRKI